MADIQIYLDGAFYSVRGTSYRKAQRKIVESRRTITGKLDRTETQVFETRYRMVLKCACSQVSGLRTSYSKSASSSGSANRLDFVDLEGTFWNSSNSGSGITNTGVYFDGNFDPELVQETGMGLLWIPIELTAVSRQMAAS